MSVLRLSGILAVVGCTGPAPYTRPDPEICDDGVDNNGNGLIDCDDSDSCGGLACRTTTITTETGADLPTAEVLFDESTCCNFTFGQDDCPPEKPIGTVSFINRSSSEDGTVDISCTDVNVGAASIAAVKWQVQGSSHLEQFIINAPVYAGQTLVMEGFFLCGIGVSESFVVQCESDIEVGVEKDSYDFNISATAN